MRKLLNLCLLISFIFLSACNIFNGEKINTAEPELKEPNPEILGINIRGEGTPLKFNPRPKPNYFYAQLVIEPTLFEEATRGPNARTFFNYVKAFIGSEEHQLGISVTPKIGDVVLPKSVLFSYAYNSKNSSWKTDINTQYVSPLVRLSGSTKIAYSFSFDVAKKGGFPLTTKIAELTSLVGGLTGAGWAISTVSEPAIKQATKIIDASIENIIFNSHDSKVRGLFQPGFNGLKEKRFLMLDDDGNKIASIRAYIRLSNVIEGGEITALSSDYEQSIPQLEPYNNALYTIRIDGSSNKNLESWLLQKDFYTNFINEENPIRFRKTCHKMMAALQGDIGLNIFDTLNVMRHTLRNTNYITTLSLFESKCLPKDYIELMEEMGIGISYDGAVTKKVWHWNDRLLDSIGEYGQQSLKKKEPFLSVIEAFRKSTVVDTSEILFPSTKNMPPFFSGKEIATQIGKLNIARFCCFKRPIINNKEYKNGAAIYFRKCNSEGLYKIVFFTDTLGQKFNSIKTYSLNTSETPKEISGILLEQHTLMCGTDEFMIKKNLRATYSPS